MVHTEHLGARAGERGGWRHEFPDVAAAPPGEVVIDATKLRPVEPMFLLRLRAFIDALLADGHPVRLLPPTATETRAQVAATALVRGLPSGVCPDVSADPDRSVAVLPLTRLTNVREIEPLANEVRELIEYQLTDISRLGDATHMAVAELCQNALEHGAHPLGAYIVAQRFTEPRRRLVVAVADLGIGIPDHVRRQYPDWHDDNFAIGQALATTR